MPPAPVSGSSPAHKMLWDISWPPPPLSSSSARAPHPCQPQHYYQVATSSLDHRKQVIPTISQQQTRPHQRSNYCKTLLVTDVLSLHNTNIQTFVLFLGKPMFSPPGPVCVCGLLVIAYHARLGRCQHLMIEVVAADRSTSG